MKYVFATIYLSICLSLATCLTREELMQNAQQCAREFNFNMQQVTSLKANMMANIELDSNSKCYISCVAKKSNLVQNGKTNEEVVKSLDSSAGSVDLGPCQGITGSDECDTNSQIVKCGMQQFSKSNLNLI